MRSGWHAPWLRLYIKGAKIVGDDLLLKTDLRHTGLQSVGVMKDVKMSWRFVRNHTVLLLWSVSVDDDLEPNQCSNM